MTDPGYRPIDKHMESPEKAAAFIGQCVGEPLCDLAPWLREMWPGAGERDHRGVPAHRAV